MATTALYSAPLAPADSTDLRMGATILVSAALAAGLFGLVHLGLTFFGLLPFFFAPFGLPHWAGSAIHLAQLALLGAAFGALQPVTTRPARFWLAGLIAAYIALPFVAAMLDSLQLSLVCTFVLLLGLATLRRVGAQSKLAGWLMTPMLAIVGVSAALGLTLAAAYTPPFALVQGQNPPTLTT
jgi:hypothetical protein